MNSSEYRGITFIGDPHLSSRVPGFRRDDYPTTALRKLRFCLEHSAEHRLLPVMLGDIFDRPRDNANWLVGELLSLFARYDVLTIHGNHDCRENSLTDDDTLRVLVKSGHIQLLSEEQPWQGTVNGCSVVIGGSSWGQALPDSFITDDSLVIWVTHHDLKTSPEMKTGITPAERPGINLIVNGHLHKRQEPIITGETTWLVPGSLTRLERSETSRTQAPSLLRLDVSQDSWETRYVEIPHESFDDVFFEPARLPELTDLESSFVKGLAELQAHRTDSGAGLVYFLEQNLPGTDESVAREVLSLAELVTGQTVDVNLAAVQSETADVLASEERPKQSPALENVAFAESVTSNVDDQGGDEITRADAQTADGPRQRTLF